MKLAGPVTFRLLVPLLLLLATPAAAGGASAGNPWQLRCPSMPEEQPASTPLRTVALRFFPWIRPAAKALQAGPVYLVALSTHTAIARDGDELDSAGFYLHRALIAVAPSYDGTVAIQGRRLGTPGPRTTLEFSRDGASACTVKSPDVICPPRQHLWFDRTLWQGSIERIVARQSNKKAPCAGLFYGRYWARTSDPQLVELVLSQLS